MSRAVSEAILRNASASEAVGPRYRSPAFEALPYISTKLNTHLSVQREASRHIMRNFRSWYAASMPLP